MTAAIGSGTKLALVDAWVARADRPAHVAVSVLALAMVAIGVSETAGAVIPVTTVEQKISATGGCSLQEAIYSANLDNNVAISRYSGSTPVEVTTQCVPGSGDDIIVLPAGAVLRLNTIVDDHINPTGPTATPIITSNITILAYGATLQRTGSLNFRLFAVGSTGYLTIRRAYVKDFRAKGGSGGNGGGGGMGAGGAIYVQRGVLVIEPAPSRPMRRLAVPAVPARAAAVAAWEGMEVAGIAGPGSRVSGQAAVAAPEDTEPARASAN